MTIATAECFRYSVPFTSPLSIDTRLLEGRQGAAICLQDDRGNEGWGEAAPLPGFSSETLPEATKALQEQAQNLTGTEVSSDGPKKIFDGLSTCELPSVEFAVESALADLWATAASESLLTVFGGGRDVVSLNALVSDLSTTVDEMATQIRDRGYSAVKLKVGHHDLQREARWVQEFAWRVGPDVALRLDANRAWTLDEACLFADRLGPVSLDYIEEPLNMPDQLSRFVQETGLPVALDETTREMSPESLSTMENVTAVVLKPTLLGGVRTVRRWCIVAHRSGVRPVFSGSYEAGIGMRMLVILASVFSEAPAGFGTYQRLENDVVAPRLPLEGAMVSVPEVEACTPERSRLTRLHDKNSSGWSPDE